MKETYSVTFKCSNCANIQEEKDIPVGEAVMVHWYSGMPFGFGYCKDSTTKMRPTGLPEREFVHIACKKCGVEYGHYGYNMGMSYLMPINLGI